MFSTAQTRIAPCLLGLLVLTTTEADPARAQSTRAGAPEETRTEEFTRVSGDRVGRHGGTRMGCGSGRARMVALARGARGYLPRGSRFTSCPGSPALRPLPAGASAPSAHAEQWYSRGEAAYRASQYVRALPLLERAAEARHAEARYRLGWMYRRGLGVQRDDAAATRYYRRAAEQGHAAAQNNLGDMYQNGRGVERSYGEALRLFRLAAEQGSGHAHFNLGQMHEKGQGVTRDCSEAVRHYRRAAELGHRGGGSEAGRLLEEGC